MLFLLENTEIICFLINNGIDPLIKNKFGFNCLHICAFRNNYCYAGIVLSKLESFEEKEKIKKILKTILVKRLYNKKQFW